MSMVQASVEASTNQRKIKKFASNIDVDDLLGYNTTKLGKVFKITESDELSQNTRSASGASQLILISLPFSSYFCFLYTINKDTRLLIASQVSLEVTRCMADA